MGKVKCKRAILRISNDSNILVCIEAHSKMPRINPVETRKEKKSTICTHDKSRAFKPDELSAILGICEIQNSITKTAAFAIHQSEAKNQAAKEKAKAKRFKMSIEARKARDYKKIELPKHKSKHTPKGTMQHAKPTKRVLAKLALLAEAA